MSRSSRTAAIHRLQAELGELVESHRRSATIDHFDRYRNDPHGFIRDVLQWEPWARQTEIIDAVQNNPLVAVRSCNGAGKDAVAAQIALWWVYCRRGLVLLTGPTERQVREIVMGEVTRSFARASELPGDLYRMALRVGDEPMGILAFTSSDSSRLTGFHAPRILACITEGQGVEDFTYEGILSCTTGDDDRILVVGNPLSPSGRFYDISRSPHWSSIQISAEEHPNVIEGRSVIPGAVTRVFVERIAAEYGRGSNTYRSRVLGEFPDQGEEALISRRWLDGAAEQFSGHAWSDEVAVAEPVLSVDPARYGPDATVAAVRRGPRLESIVAWRGLDTMQTVERLVELASVERIYPRGVGRIVVDAVGLGAGIADRLEELRYTVDEFNGGQSAREQDRFLNKRAEAFWSLRKLLEEGRIALPPDSLLFDELCAIRWLPTADGKVRIEDKGELKRRLGRSPDRADAVSMAFDVDNEPRGGTFAFERRNFNAFGFWR